MGNILFKNLGSNVSVADAFDTCACAGLDATALLGRDETLTYGALRDRVLSVAEALMDQGIGAGDFVGLFATRSIGAIVGMLACLRAGAVYVPLDPSFAPEQLQFIADDVPLKAILTTQDHHADAAALSGACVLVVIGPNHPATHATPRDWPETTGEDPACVLYTSGTTGRPKGVIVPLRAITLMAFNQPELAVQRDDVVLHASTIACDGALVETLVPLLSGAAVAVLETATPDINAVADLMIRHKVSVAFWYAGLHNLMVTHRIDAFETLRLCEAGGDVMAMSIAEKLLTAWPDLQLFNGYGPTETCVRSLCHRVTLDDVRAGVLPIGRALTGEDALVLDEDLHPLKPGQVGQLAIGGAAVAQGYFNRPEQTAATFISDPRGGHDGTVYLTGDLACIRADGTYTFEGRVDRQVKLAGRRVELDGIEHILRAQPSLTDVAVELVLLDGKPAYLAAYLVASGPVVDEPGFIAALRASTVDQIARDVFPRTVIVLDDLPLTPAGKVDRKALRAGSDTSQRPGTVPETNADPSDVLRVISEIWQRTLGGGKPQANNTFFDLGGTSLLLIEAHAQMEKQLGLRFPIAELFEVPRLGDLAARLAETAGTPERKLKERPTLATQDGDRSIAIIGMAARLPGDTKLQEFWDVIREGKSLIEHFSRQEAEDAFDQVTRDSAQYVPARSILRDVDQFDPKFFDMRPKEAALTDPQGRIFLEVCQEALDNAGLDPARAQGRVGIYAGAPMSTYMLENLLGDRDAVREFTSGFQIDYSILSGNDSSDIATRVAYRLGLTGPAISVNTACSTSLIAIAEACKTLRSGGAEMVLAGGVSITFPQKRGYLYQDSGMASPDGLCRPFDAAAQGTVFGHGAGVVVLKRLSQAVADGDHIHAVIRGVGLNNDGADKMSYTAPSITGQSDAIRTAHSDAGVQPSEIGYVECHGTATPLGDPIEISGLAQAFGTSKGSCALGAVKGNIGHLDAAAGVIGVIKAALVLSNRIIPPVAHFKTLNPRIDLSDTPFWVPGEALDWATDRPRLAGVSSFGVGGTNAHVVLEESPVNSAAAPKDTLVHLPLSAKSPEALQQMAFDMADTLAERPKLALPDVAFTLQDGRRSFDWRLSVAAQDKQAAIAKLRNVAIPKSAIEQGRADVVFLFPGQGAQYPGMGAGLYHAEPEYARWIDDGADLLAPILGRDIRSVILGEDLSEADGQAVLRETQLTQPALFLTEYALGHLWATRGITPDAVIGHSVGEFAAAALAGVMSFEDALTLIAHRGQLMQDCPGGAMLSVRATMDDLRPHLDATVDIAAHNAPKLQVIAGTDAAIDAFQTRLQRAELPCQRLHTSHAFHSRMMVPVAAALLDVAKTIDFHAPWHPIYSAVTGAALSTQQACDPSYWAGQARACVNFQAAVSTVARTMSPVFVEVGPGRTLSTCAAQTLNRSRHRGFFQSLPDHARSERDEESMAAAASNLWSSGVTLDWARLGQRGMQKVQLPSYPFQRQTCWIEAPEATSAQPARITQEAPIMPVPSVEIQDRLPRLRQELCVLLTDMSGEEIDAKETTTGFIDLGFDSLFLGQVSQAISRQYSVEIGFRKLLSDLDTVDVLARYLDAEMPAETAPVVAAAPAVLPVNAPMAVAPQGAETGPQGAGFDAIVQAQLQTMQAIFAQQLQMAGQGGAQPVPVVTPAVPAVEACKPAMAPVGQKIADFKLGRGASVSGGALTDAQITFAQGLAARYSEKHVKSKAYTATHRDVLADPRTAAGFRAEWKELTFPIVAERAKGAYIHDIDGNEFVDLVNGFGQTAFGHSPDFVTKAVTAQMERGYPIGPQADMAGPVARKFADAVGHERVTFCNTGSEAVMAAMRVARTVTGRDLIVVFDRDYHGQFDEVLVKGKAKGAPDALPIAPGIPRSGLKNMVVLPYGGDTALAWINDNIKDVAAVIVEPVQSRHPQHRPEAFVRELRDITRANGAALVIDEVVTGFRTDARGMQGVWGIQGDMATYGKVMGGGMPIGVLAGDAKFMDALDGGAWKFGDDSVPEAMPTFFAGTFVRHPLVLAAVDATLDHMAAQGDALWQDTAERTAHVAAELGEIMVARGLPDLIETYSSWFVMNVTEADPRASLLFPLMRMEGVHVMDGFCAFLTTEHGETECRKVVAAFETALDALLSVGILADLQSPEAVVRAPLAVPAPPQTNSIPLTENQREIWMSYQLGGMAAAAFNESGTLYLSGPLDVQALQSAWDQVVARHDGLRLRFAANGGTFKVMDPDAQRISRQDLSARSDPDQALAALIAKDGALPFDLTADRPIRLCLVTLRDDEHALVITAHHIVADGWSFGVFLADLAVLYGAAATGLAGHLPPAPSFAALAQAEAATGTSPDVQDYWTAQHTPPAPLPDLPADRPRPEIRSFAGDTVFYNIDNALAQALRKAGARQKCTLFATTFAAMQILVHRLSGARDFAIGVPAAAQQNLPNPDLVGHCVNFLPIRSDIAEGVSVVTQLQAARTRINHALDHQDTTFGAIVQTLDIPRQPNRLPLTEIEFNLEQDSPLGPVAGLDLRFRANAKRAVNFDLFFNLVVTENGLKIEAHFNTDLFDAARVQSWAQSYEAILQAIVEDAEQPVATLPLLRKQDQAAVLSAAALVAQPYDRGATVPDLVARTIATCPDAIAVSDATGDTTYASLGKQSDTLAALIQREVPGVGKRIALCLPRGAEMLVGLLAILKAGHTYVPLDPRQPDARLRKIAQTAEVAAVLTDDPGTAVFVADLPIPQIITRDVVAGETPSPIQVSPEQAAYVIFTSGSTGEPKGVVVPHRAVVNFLTSMAKEPGLTADDKVLAVTTVMFDIAGLELLLPLSVGALVVIAAAEAAVDGFKLADRLRAGDITVMQATPTLWDMVLTAGFVPKKGLRILCGGEVLPGDLAARLTEQGATLWNMYGPTETTIWSAIKQITPGTPITIGTPIANTSLLILDEAKQLVPTGMTGELNIGGDGLALGYYNQPDLTAKAFRRVTINGAAQMLYATGDLARQLPNGEIEVLGRIDTQVKLRGFRIELGEIETYLRAMDGISQAAVDLRTRGGGDRQLVGYVVAEINLDWNDVSAKLAGDLPDYMIPRAWVTLRTLPKTVNGKLDRMALPDPQVAASVLPLHQIAAPQTDTERQIAKIWQQVLDRDEISVTDTLQALGVDSLAMFRIAAKQLDAGMGLEARHMFVHPSIRSLAAFYDAHGDGGAVSTRPSLKSFRNGAQRRTIGGAGS